MLRFSFILPIGLLLGLSTLGCFGMMDRLTADGLCGSDSRDRARKFCETWSNAKHAFYNKDWEKAVERGQQARKMKKYEAIDQLIADAQRAIEEDDRGPFNLRLGYCPRWSNLSTQNDMFQALRCAETQLRGSSGIDRVINAARSYLREDLAEEEPSEITRAIYVHLCSAQLKKGGRPNVNRVLQCLWHADQVDQARLGKELVALAPVEVNSVLARVDGATQHLRQIADKEFPAGGRDRQIFYDLRTRVLTEHERFKRNNEGPLRTVQHFRSKLLMGEVERCGPALSGRLTEHFSGFSGDLAQVKTQLAQGAASQLAEAIAQCHYYNDRVADAAAMMHALRGVNVPSSFEEKVYFAQRAAVHSDAEKARKFPDLVGKSLTHGTMDDLSRPTFRVSKTLRRWQQAAGGLVRQMRTVDGVVSTIERVPDGARLTFKKARVPRKEHSCRDTQRIERITRDGYLVYEQQCKVVRRYSELVGPDPIVVRDPRGVKRGHFVVVFRPRKGPAAVVLVKKSPKDTSQITRMADVLLE